MTKSKKSEATNKKKAVEIEESEQDIFDEESEQMEEEVQPKKRGRKATRKAAPKKADNKKPAAKKTAGRKSKKIEILEEEEVNEEVDNEESPSPTALDDLDELSDLEIDDEDAAESSKNDMVVRSNTKPQQNRRQHAIIDPTIPIGELSVRDGLSYYIQLGGNPNNPNPTLKYGALNLLRRLEGRSGHSKTSRGSKSYRGSKTSRGSKTNRGGNRSNNTNRSGNRQGYSKRGTIHEDTVYADPYEAN